LIRILAVEKKICVDIINNNTDYKSYCAHQQTASWYVQLLIRIENKEFFHNDRNYILILSQYGRIEDQDQKYTD
jgi:hypothetical protein